MLLLSLLDLIKDELSASQGVQILHIEQIPHFILFAFFLGLLLLMDHLLKMDHVSFIAEKLFKLLEVKCRSGRINKLTFHHRNENFAKASRILGPCSQ